MDFISTIIKIKLNVYQCHISARMILEDSIYINYSTLFIDTVLSSTLSNYEERSESHDYLSGREELYGDPLLLLSTNHFSLETLHSSGLSCLFTAQTG